MLESIASLPLVDEADDDEPARPKTPVATPSPVCVRDYCCSSSRQSSCDTDLLSLLNSSLDDLTIFED